MQREIAALAQSAQSLIAAVHKDVDDVTGDTRQVLANVNDLTGETNRKDVAEILANADAMIARTSPQIDRIAKNIETVSAKMGPTVDNVNATVTNANGTITVLRDRTQTDLVELQKTLVDVRSLVDNLQVVVKSPAPPIVALAGLVGMVLGEPIGIWIRGRKLDVPQVVSIHLVGEGYDGQHPAKTL